MPSNPSLCCLHFYQCYGLLSSHKTPSSAVYINLGLLYLSPNISKFLPQKCSKGFWITWSSIFTAKFSLLVLIFFIIETKIYIYDSNEDRFILSHSFTGFSTWLTSYKAEQHDKIAWWGKVVHHTAAKNQREDRYQGGKNTSFYIMSSVTQPLWPEPNSQQETFWR